MMTVQKDEKTIWNWGDQSPIERHPLTEEEKRIITGREIETMPVADLMKIFLRNTKVPASAPAGTSQPVQ